MLLAAGALAACTPTFDWRTVRPEGTSVESLWPCKPVVARRTVALAGAERPMALHACSTGGLRFALAVVPAGDAASVSDVALALRRSMAVNVGATAPEAGAPSVDGATARTADPPVRAWTVRGATPSAVAGRVALQGRSADGRPLAAELGLFVNGTTVLQAMAVGETVPPDVSETFLASFAVAR